MSKLLIGNIEIKNPKFAITEKEQLNGLMFCAKKNPLMIFPYKAACKRHFWMKNVPIPLDIVFCCNGEIVNIRTGQPLSEDLISSEAECDLVVEMSGGFCKENNIVVGDVVKVKYDINSLKKLLTKN